MKTPKIRSNTAKAKTPKITNPKKRSRKNIPSHLTIWQLKNEMKRFRPYFEYEDYVKSRDWERNVAEQIEEMSDNTFKVVFTGLGAGDAVKVKDWVYDPKRPLDLTITLKGQPIAVIEVQADYRYTYTQSRFFPIQEHKTMQAKQSGTPTYFVYILTIENIFFWLPTETITQYEAGDLRTQLKDQIVIQQQHRVPKYIWNRGLQSLVTKLKTAKQQTFS